MKQPVTVAFNVGANLAYSRVIRFLAINSTNRRIIGDSQMKLKSALRAAMVCLFGVAGGGIATAALVTYDANQAFLNMESAASPSTSFGPFSIGYGGVFTPFSPTMHSDAVGGNTNIQGYFVNNPSFVPVVAVNVASTPTVIPNTLSTLAPGQILMHPGAINTVDPNGGPIQSPIFRFTAPTTGSYSVFGDWESLHFGTTIKQVLINGVSAFSDTARTPSFNLTANLSANDHVDFFVNHAGDISGDSVGLRATLTTNVVPTCTPPLVLQGNVCGTPVPKLERSTLQFGNGSRFFGLNSYVISFNESARKFILDFPIYLQSVLTDVQ